MEPRKKPADLSHSRNVWSAPGGPINMPFKKKPDVTETHPATVGPAPAGPVGAKKDEPYKPAAGGKWKQKKYF